MLQNKKLRLRLRKVSKYKKNLSSKNVENLRFLYPSKIVN